MDTLVTEIDYGALVAHPFADLMPMIREWEFEDLVNDIRGKGLIVPIVLYQGAILDGRNRHKACCRLVAEGVFAWHPEHHFKTFHGEEDEALAYVESLNVNRRHLSHSQRAMSAARLLEMQSGTVAKHGENAEIIAAAKEAGLNPHLLAQANSVRQRCAPHIIAMVEAGELSTTSALRTARLRPSRVAKLDTAEKVLALTGRDGAKNARNWTTNRLVKHIGLLVPALAKRTDLTDEQRGEIAEAVALLQAVAQ